MCSDSSDSDNEILENLKEAQDNFFLNNLLYANKTAESKIECASPKKESTYCSNNNTTNKEDQFNNFNVTPEFRRYVSNKLFNTLEKKLESSCKFIANLKSFDCETKSGIKLFSNSKEVIDIATVENQRGNNLRTKIRSKQKKLHLSNDSFKEISLTGDFILSQQELKHWSKRSKSQVFYYKEKTTGEMSHMPPYRLNLSELPTAPSNPKKRRRNTQSTIQPPPNVQDLLPPPLTGYGDTIVASNPFDDCPSNINTVNSMPRNTGGPPMGLGPNMVMGSNMGVFRSMCPTSAMNMNSPMMHSPNTHQMNSPIMMNSPRINHMAPGQGSHNSSHILNSPNGAGGPGNSMGPNVNMTGPPMHSPLGNMGSVNSGGVTGGPMGPTGPINGGVNGSLGLGSHGPHRPHGPHGGPGGPGGIPIQTPNVSLGQPMNNNFIMSPSMSSLYPKPMPVSAGKVYPVDQPMVFNSQNPNAPPIYPCGVCHKEVHDNDQAILCESGCNFWFHRGCTGLTEAAFQLLTAEVYAEWVCDKCLHSKNIPLVKFKP